MSVRNEAVRLSLIDDFSTPMAKAVATTKLLDGALDDLDGSAIRARQSTTDLGDDGLPKVERQAAAATREVDRLSGRLALFRDTALTVGPAIFPLSAGAVGGLAGMTSQLGAGAAAAGVAILAISGLGDGLTALNDYQLEPTQANLEKLNEEWRKLGPEGQQFVTYLDSIEPRLRSLQRASRAGFFPGAEDGLDEILTALPQVRRYIRDVSNTLGDLSADAGADLVSDDWAAFFEFVQRDGVRLLDQLARSAGNVGQGLANMLAGFAPVSEDFSAGLLDLTERFADWSTTLDDDASFQEFVSYVREAGPRTVAFLAAFTDALVGLATAAAPIGDITLPILTSVAKAFAAVADSEIGTPLLAAAAGMAALTRATAGYKAVAGSNFITSNFVTPIRNVGAAAPTLGQVGTYFYRMGQDADRASQKTLAARTAVRGFASSFGGLGRGAALMGGLAVAGTGVADGMGLSNTMSLALMGTIAGPWGAAIGGATGLMLDLRDANNDVSESLKGLNEAMSAGDADQLRVEIGRLQDELLQQDIIDQITGRYDLLEEALYEAKEGLRSLDRAAGTHEGLGTLLGQPLGLSQEFEEATRSVDEFAASFSDLQHLLDNSGSLVNYERALDDLAASMKASGSFNVGIEDGRKNIEKLNAVVTRAVERSEALKEAGDDLGALRILRRAREDLLDFGKKNEDAMRWIRPLIRQLDALNGKEVKPKADLDDGPLDQKTTKAERRLARLQAKITTAIITGDVTSVLQNLSKAERALLGITRKEWRAILRGDTAAAIAALNNARQAAENAEGTYTIRIRTVREGSRGSGMGPQPTGSADGGTVPKTGLPYADRHLYMLADGEEVTSNRYGQADAFRDVLKGINAGFSRSAIKGMLADGGTAGRRVATLESYPGLAAAMNGVSGSLRSLKERLREATRAVDENQKSVDKERRQRDAAVARRDEVASSVSGGLRSQLFAPVEDVWAASANSNANSTLNSDIARGREVAKLVKILRKKGLDGPALAELVTQAIQNDDLTLLQTYADMGRKGLDRYENRYETRDRVLASVGALTGNAAYGDDVRVQTQQLQAATGELRDANQQLRLIKAAIEKAEKSNKAGHKKTADETGKAQGAAHMGVRRAPR